jgi:regulator of sigma D
MASKPVTNMYEIVSDIHFKALITAFNNFGDSKMEALKCVYETLIDFRSSKSVENIYKNILEKTGDDENCKILIKVLSLIGQQMRTVTFFKVYTCIMAKELT